LEGDDGTDVCSVCNAATEWFVWIVIDPGEVESGFDDANDANLDRFEEEVDITDVSDILVLGNSMDFDCVVFDDCGGLAS
jgi:hypothetical protein